MKLLKAGKILLVILLGVIVLNLVLEKNTPVKKIQFGVTFSPRYAKYLKLDWQKTYLQILDDLQVRNLRLLTYWDELQPMPFEDDFSQTDFLLQQAAQRKAKVILVLGERQPRWPECHIPKWAKGLAVGQRQEKLLEFMQKVVERYKDNPQIWAWQVENEPLLGYFGVGCDTPDKAFLQKEVSLVKNLSNKTVIMTDSGELGLWAVPMSLSDVFGTTLYRRVYDKTLGYITYPVPPAFYSIKSRLIKSIFAPHNQKTIIAELQSEPWLADGALVSAGQQAGLFPVSQMKSFVDYAKKIGFEEDYLWGVEWWYFMAANGYPEYLDFARTLF